MAAMTEEQKEEMKAAEKEKLVAVYDKMRRGNQKRLLFMSDPDGETKRLNGIYANLSKNIESDPKKDEKLALRSRIFAVTKAGVELDIQLGNIFTQLVGCYATKELFFQIELRSLPYSKEDIKFYLQVPKMKTVEQVAELYVLYSIFVVYVFVLFSCVDSQR